MEPAAAPGLPQVLGSAGHEGIFASFYDLGGRVAWILRLVKTGAEGEGRTLDVMEITRPMVSAISPIWV